MKKSRKRIFAIVLFAALVLFALLGLEAALQARNYLNYLNQHNAYESGKTFYIRSDNPLLQYEPHTDYSDPSGKHIFQKDGGRFPPDVATKKTDGTLRVAVLGDSIAAQYTFPDTGNFSNHLEQSLRDVTKAQVLNWSIHGYSTQQELLFFKDHILRYQPDVLVLECCINDLAPCQYPFSYMREKHRLEFKTPKFLEYYLAPRLHVYRTQFADRCNQETLRLQRESLLELDKICKSNNISLIVVVFPLFDQDVYNSHKQLQNYQQGLIGFLQDHEISHLNLKAELNVIGTDLSSLRYSYRDIIHCNRKAHQLIGEILTTNIRNLMPRNYLPSPASADAGR